MNNWHYPTKVKQVAEVEEHVSWNADHDFISVKYNDSRFLTTTKDLLHIATFDGHDIKMKTYYLFLSDFKFVDLPTTITGLTVETSVRRGGRITDDTVQLMNSDEFIGENLANFGVDQVKTYGGLVSEWGTPITKQQLESASFGVGIRFKSHPSWPHRESPKLEYVRVRVW